MNWHDKTIQTYDESAKLFKDYFAGIESRTVDIKRAITLAGSRSVIRVVEIGCGDGRDAAEIVERTTFYVGIDPSDGLLTIARQRLPEATFIKTDALQYEYPDNLNIVYAFASLLHVDKDDLRQVFTKVTEKLIVGGVFYISLKEADHYQEFIKTDDKGSRMFYLYSADDIKDMAGPAYKTAYEDHHFHGNTNWFTIALIKV